MSDGSRSTLLVSSVVAVALVLSACTSSGVGDPPTEPPSVPTEDPTDTNNEPPERAQLTIASAAILPRAAIDLAVEYGYFDDEGIDLEFVPLQSGPEQMPLLASGQVDLTLTGPAATHFNAFAGGIDARMVAPCATSGPDQAVPMPGLSLTVRADLYESGEITTVADLAGYKIGIPSFESKGYPDIIALLELAGLTEDDVEIVAPLTFSDTFAGLQSGAIDAGLNLEPFVTMGREAGFTVTLVGDNEIMPLRLGCGIFYGQRLLEDRDLGLRWMRAYVRGLRAYNDAMFKDQGKAEAVEVFLREYAIQDPEMYDKMLPVYMDPDGRINVDSLALDVRVYNEKGLLTAVPDLADFFDLFYIEAIVDELGQYDFTGWAPPIDVQSVFVGSIR